MKRFLLLLSLFVAPAFAQTLPTPPGSAAPAPQLRALRERYNALVRRINAAQAPADVQNSPLLRFKLEEARLLLYQMDAGLFAFPEDVLKSIQTIIERAEIVSRAQGDAGLLATSQMHERAYLAANDGSIQPYWVFVPENYTPNKKYPLVIFLHGFSTDISKANPWIPDKATWSLYTNHGCILAIPYGRRNSDFVGIGEDDTTIVTEQVKAHYSVDPNRVTLMGASMGGYGVYAVGLHQPDLWAGLSPMSGRTDFYLWFKLDADKVPWWKQVLYNANDPRHLAANALNLPIFIQHGALDTLNDPEQSRRFVADMKALGNPVRYREVPEGDHYIYFEPDTFLQTIEWAAKVTRPIAPKRVVYTTGDLRNHRAYWTDISAFEDYNRPAKIEAEIKAGNRIEVKKQNVARFTLKPPAALLKDGQPITLLVNGTADTHKFETGKPIEWPSAPVVTAAPIKSPALCGPIKNIYRDPFLLVYGTLKRKPTAFRSIVAVSVDHANALRFTEEWSIYCDGVPRLRADKDLSEDDRKNYNLILFGTRESNSVLAGIADNLPLELLPNGYRVGKDKVEVPNPEEIGVQFCYPSPFDARRMIVVQSGLFWGTKLPDNHKFDLLPDYIVFDNTIEPGAQTDHFDLTDMTNRALVTGFFDGKWQFSPPKAADAAPKP